MQVAKYNFLVAMSVLKKIKKRETDWEVVIGGFSEKVTLKLTLE